MRVIPDLRWAGLIPPLRVISLTLTLKNLEPLRIGAGKLETLGNPVDLPIYRQRVYRNGETIIEPIIPGSSLKGVLRTSTMILAKTCGLKAHSGVGEDCIKEYYKGKFDKKVRKGLTPSQLREIIAGLCPACLLYGAPSIASRITVGDFTPTISDVRTGIKTGVGIDRKKGAAEPKVLYTVEYIEPGTEFKGRIRLVNTPNWLLSLFSASLLLLDEGWLKIGGFKSRGMGLVKISWNKVIVEITGIDPAFKEGILPILDEEIDEEHMLEGCIIDQQGILKCSGEDARRTLRYLAEVWPKYCEKAKPVLERREEKAKSYAKREDGE